MTEEEKQELERQINKKLSRLQEIKEEIYEIEDREELLKEYEKTLSSLKSNKRWIICVSILIALGILLIVFISGIITLAIPLLIIAGLLFIALFGPSEIKNYFQTKKVLKELSQDDYEEAKKNEEKDKELKLSLTNEYTKINQEIMRLNDELSYYKKMEGMEKSGYQLELLISNFTLQNQCMVDNRNKEVYEQLWEQYLESKDYSKVRLYNNPEVDSTIKLVKKL